MSERAPLGTRLLRELDWDAMSADDVIMARTKVNRVRSSRLARIATGFPHRCVRIEAATLDLPGRTLAVRVHRPTGSEARRPLVLSFHGGGFLMGTAAQNDWVNSRIAAECRALVIAVNYRLAPEHPITDAFEDGWDSLKHVLAEHHAWGVDPSRVAVFGESAGATIAALLTQRSRTHGPGLVAQVLTSPAVDWTEALGEYPSVSANAVHPGFSLAELHASRRFGLPEGSDAREISPIRADDLSGLPPALVITGTLDGAEDHARSYVDRLIEADVPAQMSSYPRAVHAFLSMPGLVPAARPASREITGFLQRQLLPQPSSPDPS
ncbi:alpha/beta hydrolase [Microbacterium sp. NPDC056234]|uniref:alpha/beta hydrolase n=1 Tax=Microbacterium sp. NPDC056234 TaxID=3345757 RepID=UPI0035E30175